MNREEILAYQAKQKAFAGTELGKAYFQFTRLHAKAWMKDTEDSFTGTDRKSTTEAWEAFEKAKIAFEALLMKLANFP